MSEPERISKVLARAGVGSRRAVDELIARGRVRVNGRPAVLGQRIVSTKDVVEVDGLVVPLDPRLAYYLLNKPAGVVATASDPEGRPTALELFHGPERVWTVGRLDLDTEGALVLTNDGDLTDRLTHPRYGVPKTYLAEVRGRIGRAELARIAAGVELEEGPTAPAEVRVRARSSGATLVEISVREGRNRLVRRLFEHVGHPVHRLVRTAIGPLMLGRLRPGTYRRLRAGEVGAVYKATGR